MYWVRIADCTFKAERTEKFRACRRCGHISWFWHSIFRSPLCSANYYVTSFCSGRLSVFFCLFPPCPHFLGVPSCSCQRDRLLTELILKCAMIWHKSSLRLQLKTPSMHRNTDSNRRAWLAVSFCVTAPVGQMSKIQQVGVSITSSQAEDLFNTEDVYRDLISWVMYNKGTDES